MSTPLNRTSRRTKIRFGRLTEFWCRLGTLNHVKVLVTGGGGFIGSHIVDRLLADGHSVRVLDNFATGRRENLLDVFSDIDLVEGDIQSYERVHNAVSGCEVVLHQGALPSVPRSVQDPLTSNATNVTGTLNVLLAARDSGVRRVVYASSSSIYGANPELPQHEGLLPQLPRGLRARDGGAAVLQRLRPAPGPALPVRGRRSELHHGAHERRGARGLRRRRAVARLHVRRKRRRGQPAGDGR